MLLSLMKLMVSVDVDAFELSCTLGEGKKEIGVQNYIEI